MNEFVNARYLFNHSPMGGCPNRRLHDLTTNGVSLARLSQAQPSNNIPKIRNREVRLRFGAGINLAVLVHPNRMPAGILRSLNIMLERVSNEKHLVRLQSPLITCIIENLGERLADLKFALDQNMVKELLDSQCSNFLP